jgi:hypothetical protein
LDGDTWTILILVLVERRSQWWRVLELCRDLFGGVLYLDDARETLPHSTMVIDVHRRLALGELVLRRTCGDA